MAGRTTRVSWEPGVIKCEPSPRSWRLPDITDVLMRSTIHERVSQLRLRKKLGNVFLYPPVHVNIGYVRQPPPPGCCFGDGVPPVTAALFHHQCALTPLPVAKAGVLVHTSSLPGDMDSSARHM